MEFCRYCIVPVTKPWHMITNRFIFSLLIGCSLVTTATAQQVKKEAKEEDYDKIFTKIEILGGPNRADFGAYMRKATQLPDSVKKKIPPGTYKLLISFIIDSKGSLRDIAVENDPGYGLGKRALEIFTAYKGKWEPAIQCGRFVSSYKKEPVTFVITE